MMTQKPFWGFGSPRLEHTPLTAALEPPELVPVPATTTLLHRRPAQDRAVPVLKLGDAVLTGQKLSLYGTADYVNIDGYKGILADAAGVQQPFTVCAWIKTAVNGDIIAWGTNTAGQRMNLRVDTVLRVEHGNGNIRGTNGPSLLDNEWHHVARHGAAGRHNDGRSAVR